MDSLPSSADENVQVLSVRSMIYERQFWYTETRGDLALATSYVSRMSAATRRVAALTPDGPARLSVLEEVALAHRSEAFLLGQTGDVLGAVDVHLRAVRLADSLAELPNPTRRIRGIRAELWNQLGWGYNNADDHERAVEAFTRALAYMDDLAREDPRNQNTSTSRGAVLEGRGQAHIRGERWEAALADHAASLEILSPLLDEVPGVAYLVAQSHRQRGEAFTRLGRYGEAGSAYGTSIELAEKLHNADTASAWTRKILAVSHLSHALHFRLRAAATDDRAHCAAARSAHAEADGHWTRLRDGGQIFPGEDLIWTDFLGMMPEGVC
jgi:tetratricopeptide (TPR) repeat protein